MSEGSRREEDESKAGHDGHGRQRHGDLHQLAKTAAIVAALLSLFFHSLGYLSMRFRFEAFGLNPEFSVISETFLFEGAKLMLFLLSLLPPFFFVTAPITIPLLILGAIPAVRDRCEQALRGLNRRANALPTSLVAAAGLVWATVVLRTVGPPIMSLKSLIFTGLPCEPLWVRQVAIERSPETTSLIFGALVLTLVPTLWCAARLFRQGGGWRGLGAILAGLALAHGMLFPTLFGVLVAPESINRIHGFEGIDDHREVWLAASDEDHHWFLILDAEGTADPTLLIRRRDETQDLNVVEQRPLYVLLDGDRSCGD
ncbi:MAG: hypothetical protein AAGM22_27810 [Acidobacteriota bacterium]